MPELRDVAHGRTVGSSKRHNSDEASPAGVVRPPRPGRPPLLFSHERDLRERAGHYAKTTGTEAASSGSALPYRWATHTM